MTTKNSAPWVAPLEKLPASLRPIVSMQQKHFGSVLNPTRWWGRFPFLFWLVALFVGFLERRRAKIDPVVRSLVMTRVSQQCCCEFCIDANSLRLAERSGSMDKVLAVANWREETLFTAKEKAALAYADAMTATPPQISDALKAELKTHYDDPAITELTALIAFQNLSARFNAALDIPAQGLCVSATGKQPYV
ncbi:carboxymuconolactone decarboxylase family protein [Buttiauxella agrestis]|uniref:carboxymuconolactone decarboxylase family protein n=1 Tax=Buttiauxella agrestis TaxID=82977 RepID=UPI001561AAAF|nr:carboxymuconolactone decarboxylase family protein [Buttiauxella agrestis]BCG09810.1 carboxymuconolactone decarboxylase family protein [Buttiauxella agrestis]